jgi:hypothetical protein
MWQSLILIDALSSAYWEKFKKKKERKEKRNGQGALFPGPDMPGWLCCVRFLQLLGAIKVSFKGQSLNFICT